MESDSPQSRANSSNLACPEVVGQLIAALGRKLTAYLGRVSDVREVDRWLRGEHIDADQEGRFRLALRVVDILLQKEPAEIVQSWMIGLNPELGDRVPLQVLRNEPVDVIADNLIAAATVMVTHG